MARDQVERDFVISHILNALADQSDKFVFYGGTALSRTFLKGLRLSEDIDLLSVGRRSEVADVLHRSILRPERGFGRVLANPGLHQVRKDTDACVYVIGDVKVNIQLISGVDYTPWPFQLTSVSLRYGGDPHVDLTTYTAAAFVGAKTSAWTDSTRNAPRDLYDLWATASAGMITADAARTFRKYGPTNGFPRPWLFPMAPPKVGEWYDSIGHQWLPKVGPDEAYEVVVEHWNRAVEEAES